MFELAREANEYGRVVGACVSEPSDATDLEPWLRSPSRAAHSPKLDVPLPSSVHAVFAQQVFVETRGLPSRFLNRIARLATFSNPEFYQKQAMRLSTARTPRLIGCAERTSAHVGLPRGCYSGLEDLLRQHDVELVVEDKRFDGAPLAVEFGGTLNELIIMAAMTKLDDAHARLAESDAEGDLIELASQCLMPAPAARPQSAEAVAKTIHSHLGAAEARIHDANVRAAALKRTQKPGIALTAVIAAGLAVSLWFWRDANAQRSIAGNSRRTTRGRSNPGTTSQGQSS